MLTLQPEMEEAKSVKTMLGSFDQAIAAVR
jgi:hypothetical protein